VQTWSALAARKYHAYEAYRVLGGTAGRTAVHPRPAATQTKPAPKFLR